MKSIILIILLLFCSIRSGLAQMTDEEFKTEQAKIILLLKENTNRSKFFWDEYSKLDKQMTTEKNEVFPDKYNQFID